jgi:hypothetical protein
VSLVQASLESRGIVTVSVSVMPEITERVSPPRALVVPFGLGEPLGPPGRADVHERVVTAMLAMTSETAIPIVKQWHDQPEAPSGRLAPG